MRRRRNHRGPWVLVAALFGSSLVHVAVGLPLREALPSLLAGSATSSTRTKSPVEVVRLSPGTFERTLERAKRLVPAAQRRAAIEARKKKLEEKKKKEEEQESKLNGQVVEVPASKDKRRPDNARFLAKENSRVERETVARPELRDERRKRVTNKLQDAKSLGGPAQGIPVPGMKSNGDAQKERPGEEGEGDRQAGRFRLEMPRLARREAVKLDLANLPELAPDRVWNREAIDEMPGTSDRLRIGGSQDGGEAGGRRKGDGGKQDGLPSLKDLRPTLGTVARISGSPSDDYIENVAEGEGTFLNTRSFKYATFFYQVRDSVGGFWRSDVRREMRRRDPTGDIYGPGNLKTLLFIRLDESGSLDEVRVAESSGYDFLDDVAVSAFEQAETFPNPPKGIVDADGHIAFHFSFVLFTGRRGPLDIFR